LRREPDLQWSTVSSRQNSISADLDSGLLSPIMNQHTSSTYLTSIEEDKKDSKKKKRMDLVDRANTSKTLSRQQSVERKDEDDPYAWLSKTAPPSPGYGKLNNTTSSPE